MASSRTSLATDFGERIKAIREAKGLTLEETAKAAGLGIGALSEIERAKRWRIRFEQIEQLAKALGVPAEQLLVNGARSTRVA